MGTGSGVTALLLLYCDNTNVIGTLSIDDYSDLIPVVKEESRL
jgi:hypothetical protein